MLPNDRGSGSPSSPLRDVLFDDATLGRRARTTLAGADSGVLSLGASSSTNRPVRVPVIDDDGEPLLLCPPVGPAAHAARMQRLASLDLAPTPTFGVWLTLCGRLRLKSAPTRRLRAATACPACGHSRFPDRAYDITVALAVEHVHVRCPHPHEGWTSCPHGGYALPIETYATAVPDAMAAQLPRVVRHLNQRHEGFVRRVAGRAGGRGEDELLLAVVRDLHVRGAQICWVDGEGANLTDVPFAAPARAVRDVTMALAGVPR